jgi:hypothetical protein
LIDELEHVLEFLVNGDAKIDLLEVLRKQLAADS